MSANSKKNTSQVRKPLKSSEADSDVGGIWESLSGPVSMFHIPRVKLIIPSVSAPSPMVVFAILFFSYFLVMSGIIYDIVVEPPSIGMTRDEATGANKPVAFLQWRINGQYIIEGLTAGFMFALGGVGFILLDRSTDTSQSQRNRYLLCLSGALLLLVAYSLCRVFLRIKIPGY